MVIASNAKLFSTAAALCELGPDFRFSTTLSYDGVISGNSLQGNLVVWSNGDPNISGRFYDNNPTSVFERWAAKLSESGVQSVNGDLVLDRSAFDLKDIHPDWPKNQLAYWYCAPSSAVSFNDNCVEIRITADLKTGRTGYILSPDTKYVDISFNVVMDKKLTTSRLKFSRTPGSNRIVISGRASTRDTPITEYITVYEPALFFGAVLKETLARSGIGLSGRILTVDKPYQPSGKPVKIAETSTDLAQTINVVNKRSQNFYAEQILKSMAHKKNGRGGTDGGLQIIREFLSKKVGIAAESFTVSDGSGLSRQNIFTVSQIIRLLKYMRGHKYFYNFRDSLNSERWAAPGLPAAWAKTGYIKNAIALSGYVGRENDRYYAFSLLVNGFEDQAGPGLKKTEEFRDAFIRLIQK